MRKTLFVFWFALVLPVIGAEIKFDFSSFPTDQTPTGFRSAVAGEGKPGDWKVIMDEVAPLLAPLTTQSPVVTRRAVLAQLSREALDEHFPLLIYEGETFGDFKLTTKFKTVGGGLEKMAGIAFRIQDEKNFYVVRASSLGSSFRFYKVVNGERGEPIGPAVEVSSGVWHELGVECKGSQIRCTLDGKEICVRQGRVLDEIRFGELFLRHPDQLHAEDGSGPGHRGQRVEKVFAFARLESLCEG
jgi:hypothetical protein